MIYDIAFLTLVNHVEYVFVSPLFLYQYIFTILNLQDKGQQRSNCRSGRGRGNLYNHAHEIGSIIRLAILQSCLACFIQFLLLMADGSFSV